MEGTEMEDMLFCQSCGMPLENEEVKGTNMDSSKLVDYCIYCFKNGKLTQNMTMEEMIEQCSQLANEMSLTKKEVIKQMKEYFPQ